MVHHTAPADQLVLISLHEAIHVVGFLAPHRAEGYLLIEAVAATAEDVDLKVGGITIRAHAFLVGPLDETIDVKLVGAGHQLGVGTARETNGASVPIEVSGCRVHRLQLLKGGVVGGYWDGIHDQLLTGCHPEVRVSQYHWCWNHLHTSSSVQGVHGVFKIGIIKRRTPLTSINNTDNDEQEKDRSKHTTDDDTNDGPWREGIVARAVVE